MSSRTPSQVAEIMLSWLGLELTSCTELQRLWAGYGHVCAIRARRPSSHDATEHPPQLKELPASDSGGEIRLVLKLISPPAQNTKHDDEGHLRKLLSYEVEQHFYEAIAPDLGRDVAVADRLVSTKSHPDLARSAGVDHLTATIMTDLREEFPVVGGKRDALSPVQAYAAVTWLANFHAGSWHALPGTLDEYLLPPLDEVKRRRLDTNTRPTSLWLNGGYTYLATRRSEYRQLAQDTGSEWSAAFCSSDSGSGQSVAETVADFLTPRGRRFETVIHGDVKSENLFSTESGTQVAFFDFQYVGAGLGVCDLAKLFTCSVPLGMLTSASIPEELAMTKGEEELLRKYLSILLSHGPSAERIRYDWDELVRHWETALVDWCRFQASWGFWGNTEWLQARVRAILRDQEWRDWLRSETMPN